MRFRKLRKYRRPFPPLSSPLRQLPVCRLPTFRVPTWVELLYFCGILPASRRCAARVSVSPRRGVSPTGRGGRRVLRVAFFWDKDPFEMSQSNREGDAVSRSQWCATKKGGARKGVARWGAGCTEKLVFNTVFRHMSGTGVLQRVGFKPAASSSITTAIQIAPYPGPTLLLFVTVGETLRRRNEARA